jgi:hypothetical protein
MKTWIPEQISDQPAGVGPALRIPLPDRTQPEVARFLAPGSGSEPREVLTGCGAFGWLPELERVETGLAER